MHMTCGTGVHSSRGSWPKTTRKICTLGLGLMFKHPELAFLATFISSYCCAASLAAQPGRSWLSNLLKITGASSDKFISVSASPSSPLLCSSFFFLNSIHGLTLLFVSILLKFWGSNNAPRSPVAEHEYVLPPEKGSETFLSGCLGFIFFFNCFSIPIESLTFCFPAWKLVLHTLNSRVACFLIVSSACKGCCVVKEETCLSEIFGYHWRKKN